MNGVIGQMINDGYDGIEKDGDLEWMWKRGLDETSIGGGFGGGYAFIGAGSGG